MTERLASIDDSFISQWERYKERANQQLDRAFSGLPAGATQGLGKAMRYSTLNGGKRFRAMLVYASGTCFGASVRNLDAPAVALELIHAYSLVHDDLPAMDDDDLRRGRASCHIEFDEATAILSGDALQSLAFDLLAEQSELLNAAQQLKMVQQLAAASGIAGMAGGQSLDILAFGSGLFAGSSRAKNRRTHTRCLVPGCLGSTRYKR